MLLFAVLPPRALLDIKRQTKLEVAVIMSVLKILALELPVLPLSAREEKH